MSQIPSPGDVIGERYRVVRLIGEGGMGVVFEAENIVTRKRVALKWLHPAVAARAEAAQRLIREAQATSRVRHPNVVDVYDVITHQGTIMLVLELLDGEPLHAVIERGTMKAPEFIGLLIQAMRGVAAAHALGVIHRDVHPGNIFLERSPHHREPVVKVLDFGISKIDGEATHPLTQSGTTMGTPLYMSYEQLCAARDLDARTDIYSFGVVLYRALTGHYPYAAESMTELAVQIAITKPASVKALRREIPSALDRLIMACVAKERDQRPESIEALIDELEPFASEASFRALLSGQSRAIPTLAPAHPVTRLHADGASLIFPTAEAPSTPAGARASTPVVPPAPRVSVPPARSRRWGVGALFAVGIVLVGAASAAIARFVSDSATAAPPPSLPEPPIVVPAMPKESDSAHDGGQGTEHAPVVNEHAASKSGPSAEPGSATKTTTPKVPSRAIVKPPMRPKQELTPRGRSTLKPEDFQ